MNNSQENFRTAELVSGTIVQMYVDYKLGERGKETKNWGSVPLYVRYRMLVKNHEEVKDYAAIVARNLADLHQCEVRWNLLGMSWEGNVQQPVLLNQAELEEDRNQY